MMELRFSEVGAILADMLVDAFNPAADGVVSDVVNDSRLASPGSLFVAINGAAVDGRNFIPAAIANGAAAVVYSGDAAIPAGITAWRVMDDYLAYSRLCGAIFGQPAEKLRLLGVTGTNGKTSTAYILRAFLAAAGERAGLISTIEYDDGAEVATADRTTPEARRLQELFSSMVANRRRWAVMEVSSHAMAQKRVGSVRFAGAVFTNLTGDHLDYHGDMENYYLAKWRLFADFLSGPAVVNADDDYGQRLLGEISGALSFGFKGGFCRIRGFRGSALETVLALELDGRQLEFTSNLIGRHNALNIAGAMALGATIGLPPEPMMKAAGNIRIPGRLEGSKLDNGAAVFVDYAHTDDALRNVLSALRPLAAGRLVVVFGCGGNRDVSKRPRMAAAAVEFADNVVITTDNPRYENPLSIIDDIAAGLPSGHNAVLEPDRRRAIRSAVASLAAGDVLLVAGKGHESYQEIDGVKHDFDDRIELAAAAMALGMNTA